MRVAEGPFTSLLFRQNDSVFLYFYWTTCGWRAGDHEQRLRKQPWLDPRWVQSFGRRLGSFQCRLPVWNMKVSLVAFNERRLRRAAHQAALHSPFRVRGRTKFCSVPWFSFCMPCVRWIFKGIAIHHISSLCGQGCCFAMPAHFLRWRRQTCSRATPTEFASAVTSLSLTRTIWFWSQTVHWKLTHRRSRSTSWPLPWSCQWSRSATSSTSHCFEVQRLPVPVSDSKQLI